MPRPLGPEGGGWGGGGLITRSARAQITGPYLQLLRQGGHFGFHFGMRRQPVIEGLRELQRAHGMWRWGGGGVAQGLGIWGIRGGTGSPHPSAKRVHGRTCTCDYAHLSTFKLRRCKPSSYRHSFEVPVVIPCPPPPPISPLKTPLCPPPPLPLVLSPSLPLLDCPEQRRVTEPRRQHMGLPIPPPDLHKDANANRLPTRIPCPEHRANSVWRCTTDAPPHHRQHPGRGTPPGPSRQRAPVPWGAGAPASVRVRPRGTCLPDQCDIGGQRRASRQGGGGLRSGGVKSNCEKLRENCGKLRKIAENCGKLRENCDVVSGPSEPSRCNSSG